MQKENKSSKGHTGRGGGGKKTNNYIKHSQVKQSNTRSSEGGVSSFFAHGQHCGGFRTVLQTVKLNLLPV